MSRVIPCPACDLKIMPAGVTGAVEWIADGGLVCCCDPRDCLVLECCVACVRCGLRPPVAHTELRCRSFQRAKGPATISDGKGRGITLCPGCGATTYADTSEGSHSEDCARNAEIMLRGFARRDGGGAASARVVLCELDRLRRLLKEAS